MWYAVYGVGSMLGALCGPFLLYALVRKAAQNRPALTECVLLALFALCFCLWLSTVFSSLPAA